jgi:hypothetical protein
LLKGFGNFLIKELKVLARDPKILLGMIIVPLVIFPAMGAVMGYAMQKAQEQAVKATLLIVNNDGGNWSHSFITFLKGLNAKGVGFNLTVHVEDKIEPLTSEKVLELLSKYNTIQIVEIPKGFSET